MIVIKNEKDNKSGYRKRVSKYNIKSEVNERMKNDRN
jgi:hypothetical protein